MAKTLADLIIGVRVYLDESQQADFTDAEVLRSINYAYQDVIGAVIEIYEDYYFTTTPIGLSSIANQQQYSIGANFLKLRRVEINYQPANSDNTPVRAIALNIDELPLYLANQSLGGAGTFNAGYYLVGAQSTQQIGFVPIPTVNATNNINLWGIVAPADLLDSTDSVNIPHADRFGYLIEAKAASILLKKGQQEIAAAQDLERVYAQGTLQMKTFLKERQSDGVLMIQDTQLDDIQFDTSLW